MQVPANSDKPIAQALGKDISEPKTLYGPGSYVRVKTEDMGCALAPASMIVLCMQT